MEKEAGRNLQQVITKSNEISERDKVAGWCIVGNNPKERRMNFSYIIVSWDNTI